MNLIMTYDQIRWASIQSYFILPEMVEHQMATKVGSNWEISFARMLLFFSHLAIYGELIDYCLVLACGVGLAEIGQNRPKITKTFQDSCIPM